MNPIVLATLAALAIIYGAYNMGVEATCDRIFQAWVDMPLDQNGCGGDLWQCPVEMPTDFEAAWQAACRESPDNPPPF